MKNFKPGKRINCKENKDHHSLLHGTDMNNGFINFYIELCILILSRLMMLFHWSNKRWGSVLIKNGSRWGSKQASQLQGQSRGTLKQSQTLREEIRDLWAASGLWQRARQQQRAVQRHIWTVQGTIWGNQRTASAGTVKHTHKFGSDKLIIKEESEEETCRSKRPWSRGTEDLQNTQMKKT